MKRPENLFSIPFGEARIRAPFSDVYRFFGVTIAVRSDAKEILDWFRCLYPRFRVTKPNGEPDAAYYILTEESEEPLLVAVEGSRIRPKLMADADSAASYAHLLAFNFLAARLKSHFLLHGAVVSRNGDALAIVGPSGSGKTALMLQLLLENGFKYLSDDQLVVNRATHLIDPYPRSVGIRQNTLALFSNIKLGNRKPQIAVGGQRKWFVDISEISESGVGNPCHLKYLIFLVNSLKGTKTDDEWIELVVDDFTDELLEKLRDYARGREINNRHMKNCHALGFYPEAELPSVLDFEQLCQSYGTWLLDVRRYNGLEPDFHASPEIQQIPWHEATMELLRGLQNDFRSTPGGAFVELAEILEGVSSYKLSIGKLDKMAEHVCGII